ncbi:MAG: ROK family transcriptional regulator [Spirochaetales bacterium]|nr:ROK family transcriptional regulator [Spirochaetales bacterium]
MSTILKCILNNKRITRTRLAEILRLSPSSIVKYTKILMDLGLIQETDREMSTGGRRSTFIELNPAVGINIAVILDVSRIKGVLINTTGEVLSERSLPVSFGIEKDALIGALLQLLDGLVAEASGFDRKVFGIGVGMGGYIDPERGVSHEYLFARNWYDVPLKELIERSFDLPCFLVNDANACALGEKYYGCGLGIEHFLCVWLGEGIGMGIVVNGEIYTGGSHYAGEFGHTHAVDSGQLCFCGHTGCLETVSSMQYILSTVRDGLGQGVNSEVLKYCDSDFSRLRIEHLITASNNGDRLARNVFQQAGGHLGEKLADIANVFNPQMIVLRGPIIDANRFLFETIERVVMNLTLRQIAKPLKMVFSEQQSDIRVQGISSVVLHDYFTH